MQNGTTLITFTSTQPVAETTAPEIASATTAVAPPTTFTKQQLADLKEQIANLVDPELLSQLFPEGVDALNQEQFAAFVEELPPFLQQALQLHLSGKALPQDDPALPLAANVGAAGRSVAEGVAGTGTGTGAGTTNSTAESTTRAVVNDRETVWLPGFKPLSDTSTEQQQATVKPAPANINALDTDMAASSVVPGELSALLRRGAQDGQQTLKSVATSLEPLTQTIDGDNNVVPLTNGYSVQSRVVQPGGEQRLVTEITQTVGTARWGEAVVDKVMWLSSQNVSSAQIRLDPPDLGPLEVKISINSDQANVVFNSQHAQVRDALEQQLMRLRELFDQQGLQLVNVDVSDQSLAQQQGEAGDDSDIEGNDSSLLSAEDGGQADSDESVVQVTGANRLVDYYA